MSVKRPFVLGLTGSIGMGKSTTAGFFKEMGILVWDADAAVHRLYSKDGAAVLPISVVCPNSIVNGAVDRAGLRRWIARDDKAIKEIEKIVHPLVAEDRQNFIKQATEKNEKIVVVDIPLLFETGGNANVDATLVVSAPAAVQKARVLEREGMTASHFDLILDSQMPDDKKRRLADYVIETVSLEKARHSVAELLKELREKVGKHA